MEWCIYMQFPYLTSDLLKRRMIYKPLLIGYKSISHFQSLYVTTNDGLYRLVYLTSNQEITWLSLHVYGQVHNLIFYV